MSVCVHMCRLDCYCRVLTQILLRPQYMRILNVDAVAAAAPICAVRFVYVWSATEQL